MLLGLTSDKVEGPDSVVLLCGRKEAVCIHLCYQVLNCDTSLSLQVEFETVIVCGLEYGAVHGGLELCKPIKPIRSLYLVQKLSALGASIVFSIGAHARS
jgi:hypothetical protein